MDEMEQAVRDAMGLDESQPTRLTMLNKRPAFEYEAQHHLPLQVTSGTYKGLSGIIQEIRQSNEGYVYGLSDLPHPANPNQVHWFMEHQLQEKAPTHIPNSPTGGTLYSPDISRYAQPVRLDAYMERMSLVESIQMELRILREEMSTLRELVSQQMGRVRVHVTYQEIANEPTKHAAAAATAASNNGRPVSDNTRPGSQTRTEPTRKPGPSTANGTRSSRRRKVPDRNRTPEVAGLSDESGHDSIPEPAGPETA